MGWKVKKAASKQDVKTGRYQIAEIEGGNGGIPPGLAAWLD